MYCLLTGEAPSPDPTPNIVYEKYRVRTINSGLKKYKLEKE